MSSLLKFEMQCEDDLCDKKYVILVDPEETETPNVCPFCGNNASEGWDE
jgi:hypothetical protein